MVDVPYDAIADAPPAKWRKLNSITPRAGEPTSFRRTPNSSPSSTRLTASAIGLVAAGVVVADATSTGISGHVFLYRCKPIPPVITMPRHDHGDLPAHALFLGGFGNYLIPLMVAPGTW